MLPSVLLHTLLIMLFCLLGTMLIEAGAGYLLGARSKKDVLNILLVNLITNPVVSIAPVTIASNLRSDLYLPAVLFFEAAAVLAEGLLYRRYLSFRKIPPLWFSLLLNVLSYGTGQFIYLLF